VYTLTNTNTDFKIEFYYWVGTLLSLIILVLNIIAFVCILCDKGNWKFYVIGSWLSIMLIIIFFIITFIRTNEKEFNYYTSENIVVLNKIIDIIENIAMIQLDVGYFNYVIYNTSYNCSFNDDTCIGMYNISDKYTINNMSYANYISNYHQLYTLSNEHTYYKSVITAYNYVLIIISAYTGFAIIVMIIFIYLLMKCNFFGSYNPEITENLINQAPGSESNNSCSRLKDCGPRLIEENFPGIIIELESTQSSIIVDDQENLNVEV